MFNSVTLCTIACQAPLSMKFSRQEYWSRIAVSFSRGSSQPRDWTHGSGDSCIDKWVLYHWATWEVLSFTTCIQSAINFYQLKQNFQIIILESALSGIFLLLSLIQILIKESSGGLSNIIHISLKSVFYIAEQICDQNEYWLWLFPASNASKVPVHAHASQFDKSLSLYRKTISCLQAPFLHSLPSISLWQCQFTYHSSLKTWPR